jgi:hypothetical protein
MTRLLVKRTKTWLNETLLRTGTRLRVDASFGARIIKVTSQVPIADVYR